MTFFCNKYYYLIQLAMSYAEKYVLQKNKEIK